MKKTLLYTNGKGGTAQGAQHYQLLLQKFISIKG